jgi:hypothetical protein
MNYLEALINLIRNKKELFANDDVGVSLGEIADAWNRQNIYREDQYNLGGLSSFKWKVYTIEMGFLQDLASGIKRLQEKKEVEFKYIIKHQRYVDKKKEHKPLAAIADIYSLDSLQDKIYFKLTEEAASSGIDKRKFVKSKFVLTTAYRQVYVNDYIISIPQEGSNNKMFLDYVMSKPNEYISASKLPDHIRLGTQSFIKVLASLGFTGDIRKAFFKEVGKKHLIYKGNTITEKELIDEGVDVQILIKELELKHSKNIKKSIATRTI